MEVNQKFLKQALQLWIKNLFSQSCSMQKKKKIIIKYDFNLSSMFALLRATRAKLCTSIKLIFTNAHYPLPFHHTKKSHPKFIGNWKQYKLIIKSFRMHRHTSDFLVSLITFSIAYIEDTVIRYSVADLSFCSNDEYAAR